MTFNILASQCALVCLFCVYVSELEDFFKSFSNVYIAVELEDIMGLQRG